MTEEQSCQGGWWVAPLFTLLPRTLILGNSEVRRAWKAPERFDPGLKLYVGACQCAFVAQSGVTPRPAYPVVLWGLPRSSSGGPPCSRSSSAAFWGDGSSSTQ